MTMTVSHVVVGQFCVIKFQGTLGIGHKIFLIFYVFYILFSFLFYVVHIYVLYVCVCDLAEQMLEILCI